MSEKASTDYAKQYTKPELRAQLKEKLKAGDKGGRAGQWSARKSQLLTTEYEKAGGGYKGKKGASQKSLEKWGDEKWQTKSGSARARHGKTTDRYLPKKAWDQLSDAEEKATDKKKQTSSRSGKQFVPNTRAAKAARARATGKSDSASKAEGKTAASAMKPAAKSATAKRANRPKSSLRTGKKASARNSR